VNRTGVRLRARKGYWALWPDEALAAEMIAKASDPARAPVPGAVSMPWRSSPLIRPWFGVSRGERDKTRMTFVWEPAPRIPGDRSRIAPPARIHLTATAPDGTELFRGFVCGAGVSACESPRAVFDVAPGRVRLQMSIEDSADQVIDSDVRDISVRDLTGPVALGTAEILRTRNAREFRAVDADPAAAPVAAREFSRTERLIVRFPAYAPDGNPRVSVRLVNRVGQTLRDLPHKDRWPGRPVSGRPRARQPRPERVLLRAVGSQCRGRGERPDRIPSHQLTDSITFDTRQRSQCSLIVLAASHPATGPGLREVELNEPSNALKVTLVVGYENTPRFAA